MRHDVATLVWAVALCLLGLLATACSAPKSSQKHSLWPFHRSGSDKVPGLVPPSDRIATLRKLGKQAAWAKPAEQEQVSSELAAAFPNEADPLIRMEIVRAIAGYRTDAATSVLDAALKDSDPDVRVVACGAWGKRGGPEAVARLSEVLASDVDAEVRLTAARALGETGEPAAIPALGLALEERDPAMQYQAVASLRKVSDEDLGNDAGRWRQYLRGETPNPPEPVSIADRIRRLF